MVICRSLGFIFLRVPKTASSSISEHLIQHITFNEHIDSYSKFMNRGSFNCQSELGGEHPTLEMFLKTKQINQKDISNLKVYGVLREPISRTISLFNHVLTHYEKQDTSNLTSNQILEKGLTLFHKSNLKYVYFAKNEREGMVPLHQQSNWLMHYGNVISNILVYPNFKSFLKEYTQHDSLDIQLKPGNKFAQTEVDNSLTKEIKLLYHQDFILWNKYDRTGSVSY